MLMSCSIAIAAGLNPYVTTLFVAALAGLASRVHVGGPFADLDPVAWRVMIGIAAVLATIDLTVGKLRRRFPLARRVGLVASILSGAAGAAIGIGDGAPPEVAAVAGALLAGVTSHAVTRVARAALAGGGWIHLGHIPVMMLATGIAAVTIPLTLAFGWPGTMIAVTAGVAYVAIAARLGRRASPSPPAPPAPTG